MSYFDRKTAKREEHMRAAYHYFIHVNSNIQCIKCLPRKTTLDIYMHALVPTVTKKNV